MELKQLQPELLRRSRLAPSRALHTWRMHNVSHTRADDGSCSPSLLELLLASLGAGLLGSGLALAERLGAMTGMGSRG
jgi:hypothetical protein